MSATNFNRLLGGVSFSSRSDQADLQLGEFNGNKVSTAVTRFSKMLRDASMAGLVKLRCGVKQKRQSPVRADLGDPDATVIGGVWTKPLSRQSGKRKFATMQWRHSISSKAEFVHRNRRYIELRLDKRRYLLFCGN